MNIFIVASGHRNQKIMSRKSSFNPSIHSIYRLSRITAGATLQKVSEKMGVSLSHLHNIEHGRRSMTNALQNKWNKAIEGLGRRKR